MTNSKIIVILAACALTFGCGEAKPESNDGSSGTPKVTVVAKGLMNPSCVSFSPAGELTICDSGNGRVVVLRDGKLVDYVTDFDTEFWKIDKETDTKRFKLGPLSAIWLGKTLVVTDGGKKDGKETLLFFSGPGKANSGVASNTMVPAGVAPEKGEGNLTGMSASGDMKMIYLCGQGSDDNSWILQCDVAGKKLSTFASADVNGIKINSPMQILNWDDNSILALFSGKGGADDGLVVKWDKKTAKVLGQWQLTGLKDPMGMARVPGSDDLMVVDNNWALTKVNQGALARVSLKAEGKIEMSMIDIRLNGPVSCGFGPGGNLFIAQLGTEFDSDKGEVLKVSGL
ncbi:MAG: hypothetical protein ACI97A_000384 [Planctomycetota bacterium]|jgi:hypothetical protein